MRPTPEARGYLKFLTKQEGVFGEMIDGYTFAAAYAIYNQIEPETIPSQGRQPLQQRLHSLDEDVLLSLEAGIAATYKRQGKPEPKDSKELLEILTQYAEAGLKVLKQRWDGKVCSQIQNDISQIIQSSL
jgi:hypothetical protein